MKHFFSGLPDVWSCFVFYSSSYITIFLIFYFPIYSGDNASTLHYGHAGAPNDKTIHDGDMV